MSENTLAGWNNNTEIYRETLFDNEQVFGTFNKVRLSGIIESDFKYSHENDYDRYYNATIKIPRRSGVEDHIPIMVPYQLIKENLNDSLKGLYAKVAGCIRTKNMLGGDGRKHLKIYVYVKGIEFYGTQEEARDTEYDNFVYLEGRICKLPTFRVTPLGREITDLMVAVNRYNDVRKKADYVPCIAWGSNARDTSWLNVNDTIALYGRMQSREYTKRCSMNPEKSEVRVTYEVSIMKIE